MVNHHDSPSPSPSTTPTQRRMKTCARKCERACCTIATFFPLAFVYSLSTWGVWVDAGIGFGPHKPDEKLDYAQKIPSAIGVVLYLLLNASYTTAVFKNPGSPTQTQPTQGRGRYSELPTTEPIHDHEEIQTITVSSTGSARYCKKCHVQKPDRTHHCSTCKRCVLKMDHHCPWLATCLGLHNYKAFVLFLVYTSLFCWACFYNSASYVWREIFDDQQNFEQLAPVNAIMLAVLSGILGLVLTGFTSWHLYLCTRGLTTIECLEKTRYLSGVRKVVEQNRQERSSHSRETSDGLANNLRRARDQILEFHANAVPGASRFEEGEERTSPAPSVDHNFQSFNEAVSYRQHRHEPQPSDSTSSTLSDTPAQRALRSNFMYRDHERSRETARYEEYLDEKETSALPNAFDLGWRKNLSHVFGPQPWLWWLPICNTTGDGWRWEVSQKWRVAQEEMARRKEERLRSAANHPSHHQGQQENFRGQLRGGGAGKHYDNYDEQYEQYQQQHVDDSSARRTYADSAMSMQTLHSKSRVGGAKMRRDFDTTGEDGEVASFQVSGSEDEDESDSDSDSDGVNQASNGVGRRKDTGDNNGSWGSRW